jgi:hypothetical protein
MIFKLQHPGDLISRLFILEYMRDIGAKDLYAKANKHQKEDLFYKFTSLDSTIEEVDLNWEFLIFGATLHQLDSFMQLFLIEIEAIDKLKEIEFKKMREELILEEETAPVDINVMDMAQTEINKTKGTDLLDSNGQKLG